MTKKQRIYVQKSLKQKDEELDEFSTENFPDFVTSVDIYIVYLNILKRRNVMADKLGQPHRTDGSEYA